MADLDAQEIRRRAWAAIDTVDATNARLRERAEARLMAGSDLGAPTGTQQPPPAPPARQRPSTRPEGRDWPAEAAWINSLIGAQLAGLRSEIAEGVGMVIARERAAQKEALARLRTEIRAEFKQGLVDALSDILRALRNGDGIAAKLDEHLAKFDRLVEKRERADIVRSLGLADIGLPN